MSADPNLIKSLHESPMLSSEPGPQINSYGQGASSITVAVESPKVSNRWYYVLALHLKGMPTDEIAELTDYSQQSIYKILRDDRIIRLRQLIMSGLADEFEALHIKVVQAIRDALDSDDIRTKLEGAEKWLKAHGKYRDQNMGIKITGEDVVVQILNQYRQPNGHT